MYSLISDSHFLPFLYVGCVWKQISLGQIKLDQMSHGLAKASEFWQAAVAGESG